MYSIAIDLKVTALYNSNAFSRRRKASLAFWLLTVSGRPFLTGGPALTKSRRPYESMPYGFRSEERRCYWLDRHAVYTRRPKNVSLYRIVNK